MTSIKIILIIYLILVTGIGLFSFFRIRDGKDYYISGKNGNWWQISGSLFATILGGSAILGTIELSQKAGWAAVWFPVSASLGLMLLVFIAPKVNRLGHYTLPEMISRFYGKKAEKTAAIIIPAAWLGVIAVQIIAGAKTLAALNLMSYQTGAVTCAAVFIFYTLLGGQKSILKTDFVQAFIILSGLIILTILKYKNLQSGNIPIAIPRQLLNASFGIPDILILLITYSVTFIVGPDIYSRIFCARTEKTARNSVITTAILIIPVAFMLVFLGISGAGEPTASSGTDFIIPGSSFLPSWGVAVVAVVMLSAVMSSADTTLLTTSAILSELVTGNLDKKKSLTLTRLFIIPAGLFSLFIALKITSILGALMISFSFFSGAFVLPVLAGITGLKVNRHLAFFAMIAGGITALAGKIIQEVFQHGWGYALIGAAYAINALLLFFPDRKEEKNRCHSRKEKN